ncbi:MAG: class I SAM-dependent methyltransferase [Pseudomonadota bacterium]
MKMIRKLGQDLEQFEEALAARVADVAALLTPLPEDRAPEALDLAWRDMVAARRKLAGFVKSAKVEVGSDEAAEGAPLRLVQTQRKAVAEAQRRLRYAARFETAVQAQLETPRRPLTPDHVPPDRAVEVMDHVVTMFLDGMHRAANPTAYTQSAEANDRGFHCDIALPMLQFSRMIAAAYRICLAQRKAGPLRFLDVGSGGGTKVLAATTCFEQCDGLEFETDTVDTGAQLLSLLSPDTCRLIHGDATRFDGYDAYDVIYFYRPLADAEGALEMEQRMFDQARPGTVLIVAGGLFSEGLAARGIQRLSQHIYVTGTTDEEATVLRRRAEQMGTDVPGYGRRALGDLGYWAVLRDACAQNGVQV